MWKQCWAIFSRQVRFKPVIHISDPCGLLALIHPSPFTTHADPKSIHLPRLLSNSNHVVSGFSSLLWCDVFCSCRSCTTFDKLLWCHVTKSDRRLEFSLHCNFKTWKNLPEHISLFTAVGLAEFHVINVGRTCLFSKVIRTWKWKCQHLTHTFAG